MKHLTIAAAVAALTCLNALGWGQKGHDVTAALAQKHLTPVTAAKIDSLLDGRSIVYYANWLDNASHTPEYAYSKSWHYKNINVNETYENAWTFPKGDVVTGLTKEIDILLDPASSKDEKALAVKMIVHLVGDMHQPMHLGRGTDLGGNRVKVKYFDSNRNLHGIWDSALVESAHKWSYTEWVQEIDIISPDEAYAIADGNLDSWAKETYEICKEVYDKTPEGTKVSYDYIANAAPVIENQLLKGGYRLADVLNAILDPDYKPVNSIKSLQK